MNAVRNASISLLLVVFMAGCGDTADAPNPSTDTLEAGDVSRGDIPRIEDTTSPDETSPVLDAGEDAFLPETDTEQPAPDTVISDPDTNTPPESEIPTWWECRQSAAKQAMTAELKSTCNDLHKTNPVERKYGIRWVVLDEKTDADPWIESRLAALNSYFEAADISFVTSSKITLQKSIIVDPGVGLKFPWEVLSMDTAQHLLSATSSPEELLNELKQALSDAGVAPGAIKNLELDKEVTAKAYFSTMARIRPAEIHVILTPLLNGTKGGGLSSGPASNPANPRVSVLFVRAGQEVSPLVIAHEMGHFFGLIHPHAQLEKAAAEAVATLETAIHPKSHTPNELIEALGSALGQELDGPFELKYPAWNAKSSTTLKSFDQYRIAMNEFWLGKDYFYRNLEGVPSGYETLSKFIIDLQSNSPVFYKNFIAPGMGNNCSWNTDAEDFSCDIGDPTGSYSGSDPLVDGSILLDASKRVNIMSYIAKTMGKNSIKENMVRFTEKGIQVMKLHANTPSRLMLRNHAL